MATTQHVLLSPAELAYLHDALAATPHPVRPDGRLATQFRPLTAETGVLPGAHGSARVCFADGTEAVAGVKAEVGRTTRRSGGTGGGSSADDDDDEGTELKNKKKEKKQKQKQTAPETATKAGKKRRRKQGEEGGGEGGGKEQQAEEAAAAEEDDGEESVVGDNSWVEVSVEIQGYRDDDSSTVFLATMLSEALLADGGLTRKLRINRRFHWKLYLDIILISPPLSYPLPLLSLTTHLALLAARLPRLRSEGDEDPMFDDDWAASTFIYPRRPRRSGSDSGSATPKEVPAARPPITLLVIAVGENIIFDPSKEELVVADSALAVSVGEVPPPRQSSRGGAAGDDEMDVDDGGAVPSSSGSGRRDVRLLSVRTIDPPSRLTAPGVPNAVNAAAWAQQQDSQPAAARENSNNPGSSSSARAAVAAAAETDDVEGVWKPPRGGAKLAVLGAMVQKVLERGGVAHEVLEGLDGVELA
ncbi:hypothetical protein GGR56DRAFT_17900 [Xylariaceae sp. FL0804]|nr:hypothetical protein GGR56DRAFT_17900 [Xylariaceae sp. FL0804]